MADAITALFQPTLEAQWLDLQFIAADQLQLPTTDWGPYSPERNILILSSRMMEALNVACIERYRGMFIGYSEGEPLTILCQETYLTPRLPATFATCLGQFNNPTVNVYNVAAGDYVTVKKSTTDNVTYRIDGPLVIGPGATPLPGVTVRAVVAGSVGSANPGEIDEIEGNVFGGVQFANISTAVGLDVESDEALASRARLAATALSVSGPSGAYEYYARGGERFGQTDTAIAAIGVNRVAVIPDYMSGGARVYFATPSGPVAGTATTGDLGLINAKLLLRVVPVGMSYIGASAVPVTVDVDYVAYVMDDLGVDAEELKEAILANLVSYFATARIGGWPQITPTPGFTGSLTSSKVRGFVTAVELGDIMPVHDATNSLNTLGEVLLTEEEVPVLGIVTGSVVFQPRQEA